MISLIVPLASVFSPPSELLGPIASTFLPPSGVPRFDLRAELDNVAKSVSSYFNNSIYIGVQGVDLDPANPIGVADGDRDRFKAGKQQATPDDLVPGGSITKATAAVLALQLAEQGKLDLDKPITEYIDPWFAQLPVPRFPLAIMWGNASIINVTTRMLLSMRSGLMDYDDSRLLEWTALQGAPRDFEPLDFVIWATDHSFLWTPGGGGFYSGTGYVLLGMVLASASGAKQWFDLDQTAVFDPLGASKKAWYANQTIFMGKGACSDYGPRVIPQYVDLLPATDPSSYPKTEDWADLLTRQSCLNGWTMGNILTTPGGLAQCAHTHTGAQTRLSPQPHAAVLPPSLTRHRDGRNDRAQVLRRSVLWQAALSRVDEGDDHLPAAHHRHGATRRHAVRARPDALDDSALRLWQCLRQARTQPRGAWRRGLGLRLPVGQLGGGAQRVTRDWHQQRREPRRHEHVADDCAGTHARTHARTHERANERGADSPTARPVSPAP